MESGRPHKIGVSQKTCQFKLDVLPPRGLGGKTSFVKLKIEELLNLHQADQSAG